MKQKTYSNMTEALKGLSEIGYTANFTVENGNLKSIDEDKYLNKDDIKIVDSYRFEGESDPDDMAILYVIEADSGQKGTLVDAFGLYANKETGDFINNIKDVRENTEPTNTLPSDQLK